MACSFNIKRGECPAFSRFGNYRFAAPRQHGDGGAACVGFIALATLRPDAPARPLPAARTACAAGLLSRRVLDFLGVLRSDFRGRGVPKNEAQGLGSRAVLCAAAAGISRAHRPDRLFARAALSARPTPPATCN